MTQMTQTFHRLSRHLLIYFAFLLISSAASAETNYQHLSPRQVHIFQTVLQPNGGYITPDLHDEFWSSLPPSVRQQGPDNKTFSSILKRLGTTGILYNREVMLSAQASLLEQRVAKSPKYEQAKEQYLGWALPGQTDGVRAVVATSEKMIEAAAKRTAVDTPNGPIYITEEYIEQILSGLDASLERFEYLSDPSWQPHPIERSFPNAHVRILWDAPFIVQSQVIEAPDGHLVRSVTLSASLSESEWVGVSFQAHGGVFADPSASLRGAATSALANGGVQPGNIAVTTWRGLLSAAGGGSAQTSVGGIHAVVRVVELRTLGGVLVFLAVSGISLPDASKLLDRLARATQLSE